MPWTGDYLDGLYNKFTMIAYANPAFASGKELKAHQRETDAMLGDGYGLIRFDKRTREITFECWPRYADVSEGDAVQYPGWPVRFRMEDNDGREVYGCLPELVFDNAANPVVQVLNEATGEILYTQRIQGNRFRPRVFGPGKYTVKAGRDRADAWQRQGLVPAQSGEEIAVHLQ